MIFLTVTTLAWKLSFLVENSPHFLVRYPSGIAMVMGKYRDEWNIDSLVLGHNIDDRKVSAKSVTACHGPM